MKISINHRTWDIKQVKPGHQYLDNDCGVTVFNDSIIYINKNLNPDLKKDTILHELAHAYLFVNGMNQIQDGTFTEENVADIFGSFSYDLVKQGEKVFKSWKLV